MNLFVNLAKFGFRLRHWKKRKGWNKRVKFKRSQLFLKATRK